MDELHEKENIADLIENQVTEDESEMDSSGREGLGVGVGLSLLGLSGCISELPQAKSTVTIPAVATPQPSNGTSDSTGITPTLATEGDGGSVSPVSIHDDTREVPDPSINPRTFKYLKRLVTLGVSNMQGQQEMSDGALVPVWGFQNQNRSAADFAGFNNDRHLPGPVIELIEGEQSYITLVSQMPHSIHFHGLDTDQANDGVPFTSGYVAGVNGVLMGNFGRVTGYTQFSSPHDYSFVAPHAGTYMYHCHVDTALHSEMGMAGTIIVRRPDGNPNVAWENGPTIDKEYIWHLHTFDSQWHRYRTSNVNTVRYRPDYFLLNGKEGPALLEDPVTAITASIGQKVLIRCVNIGILPAMVTLGDNPFEVIASDGRPLRLPIMTRSYLVGPGERYDLLFTMPANAQTTATVEYWPIVSANPVRLPLGSATTSMTTIAAV